MLFESPSLQYFIIVAQADKDNYYSMQFMTEKLEKKIWMTLWCGGKEDGEILRGEE